MLRKLIVGLAMMPLVLAGTSFAQTNGLSSDATTSTARATIIRPIDVISEKDLVFGAIVRPAPNTFGYVTITPSTQFPSINDENSNEVEFQGTITPINVSLVNQSNTRNGHLGQARFKVRGEPGYSFHITLPNTSLQAFNIMHGNGDFLEVSNFTSYPASTGVLVAATHGGGVAYFNVGATVKVEPKSLGWYSKEFNVITNYE